MDIQSKRNGKIIIHMIFAFMLVFFCENIYAKEENEIVKVGYVIYQGYQEGEEGEYKTGYGYEYYQKLSYYTGRKYEYVYGNFSDLLEKLEAGEIDIIGNLTYTKERAEKFNFSNEEQGQERYYLYVTSEEDEISSSNIKSLNGKRVGVTEGSYQQVLFNEWCDENNIECEMVSYADNIERSRAMNRGEIDATVSTTLIVKTDLDEDWKPIIQVGAAPFYFAVNKERNDLLKELNEAHLKILMENRFYNEEVYSKYVKGDALISNVLDDEEIQWINNNGTINVGYINDYLPFCDSYARNGEISGMAEALLDFIENNYNVDFKSKKYNSYDEMLEALSNDEVDIILPVLGDYWNAEKENIALTQAVTNSGMLLLYRGEYRKDITGKIAVTKSSPFSYNYAKIHYSDAELIEYNDIWECVDAVIDKEADSMLFNTSCYQVEKKKNPKLTLLQSTSLEDTVEICFATRKGDIQLLSFINKGIVNTPENIIREALLEASNVSIKYTILDMLRVNMEVIIGIAVAIIVIIILLFRVYVKITVANQKKLMLLNEQANRAREEAERANEAKTEFLHRMSHDIRTPINGIVGMLQIIKAEIEDKDTVIECLDKIKEASNHLLLIINDMLQMSKLETGKIELVEDPFIISDILDSQSEIIKQHAQTKGISINVEEIKNLRHSHLIGSPIYIQQILMNIIMNAIKYNKVNGSINFSCEEISYNDRFATFEFIISDTGIGMTEEFQQHIFELFSQEKDDARGAYRGTGLGLAIAKELLDMMNGSIDFSSELGVGTTFVVTIPLIIDKDSIVEDENVNNYNFKGKKVLLVEDVELNREIVKYMLEEVGIEVIEAVNGQEAVDIIQNSKLNEIDAVLMDIMMPVMDGITATKKIRNLPQMDVKVVPIIALTANAFEEDRQLSYEAGMNEHLTKPIDTEQLLKVLYRYLK